MRTFLRIAAAAAFSLLTNSAFAQQSISEKILRESPRLSWSASFTADSNLQDTDTYENERGALMRVSPRYRINESFTAIASLGVTQRFTQENRTDMTNATISLSRNPMRIGTLGDLRATGTLILPTNEIQRDKESLRGALRLGTNFFVRTNTSFILETGISATMNNHQYSVSAFDTPNIQWRTSPYINMGWGPNDKWQFFLYSGYDSTWTYRNTYRGFFTLDESITYIPSREWSFTAGHTNAGSITTLDGRNSNIAFYDTRTSVFYLNGTFNF